MNPKCAQQQDVKKKTIKPSFAPMKWLEAALNLICTEEETLVLCLRCYNELYRQFNSPTPCASCGGIPKQGSILCRHSPDAIAVSNHLQRSTGSNINIQPTDYLCNTCYKMHLTIVTSLEKEKVEAEKTLENCITRLRSMT